MAENLTLLGLVTQRGKAVYGEKEWNFITVGKSLSEQNELLPPHLRVRWAGFKLLDGWKR